MDTVTIIHPVTGGIVNVPQSSLRHYYASGWRLLAGDEAPDPVAEPEPVTLAQAAGLATPSDGDDSEER